MKYFILIMVLLFVGCATVNPCYDQKVGIRGNWTGMTHPDMNH